MPSEGGKDGVARTFVTNFLLLSNCLSLQLAVVKPAGKLCTPGQGCSPNGEKKGREHGSTGWVPIIAFIVQVGLTE